MAPMLYIIATPIGNLGDITFRAVETLKNVDKIYCEDTRRTSKLLAHFAIQKPLESFHEHSEAKIERIVEELKNGGEIAYVSDAGTPGINDPGGKLVDAARSAGIEISPIPGPSSVTALLSVAGIAADKYSFMGFVPTKKGRETFLKKMLLSETPVVFFETAPRLHKLFDQLISLDGGERNLIVGRELTKKFEEIKTGLPAELKEHFVKPIGELVLILTSDTRKA